VGRFHDRPAGKRRRAQMVELAAALHPGGAAAGWPPASPGRRDLAVIVGDAPLR
jgi:hypothetical protein